MGVFIASGVKEYKVAWCWGLIINPFPSGAHILYRARQFNICRF
jgi:hypothetical protein